MKPGFASNSVRNLGASILDGCDGEVARLKYQESAFGCWLETIGDYMYYFAIFIGITIGAVRSTGYPVFYDLGAAAVAGSLITPFLLLLLRPTSSATGLDGRGFLHGCRFAPRAPLCRTGF